MNWLDIFLVLVLLLSTVSAWRKGFSREVIGIGAALVGLICGIWFYGIAGAFLLPYVSSPQVANFIGFFIVFIGCVVLGAVTSAIISRFVKTVGLSWFDHFLGAVFGVIRGTLLGLAVITALPSVIGKKTGHTPSEKRRTGYCRPHRTGIVEQFTPKREKRGDGFHGYGSLGTTANLLNASDRCSSV